MTRRRATWLFLVVAVFAAALRVILILDRQAGFDAQVNASYDEAVYVGASWLLRQGHLPYRDFVFVFPPGFLIVMWPITTLAGLFGGPALALTGLRIAAAVAGGCNTFLVARMGARWMGWAGGLSSALIFATLPAVVGSDTVGLQEPFVNLAVLLAFSLWIPKDRDSRRQPSVVVGLLLGVAISIKLVAGVFLIPVLIVGLFRRPLVDRARLVALAAAPVVATIVAFGVSVGWRVQFEQIVAAQVLRPRDGEGLSRINSLLPILHGRAGTVDPIAGAAVWVAVALFASVCIAALIGESAHGRLWGLTGLVTGLALMVSPSYFWHYGSLLAPAAAMLVSWLVVATIAALRQRQDWFAPTAVVGVAILIGATQLVSVFEDADTVSARTGPELAQAIAAAGCLVAQRPQALLDVSRVPSAVRGHRVLLDVYGEGLLAALQSGAAPGVFRASSYPSVQREIVAQSRACESTLLIDRACTIGRKDLTARTQRVIKANSVLVARRGCTVMYRNRGNPASK